MKTQSDSLITHGRELTIKAIQTRDLTKPRQAISDLITATVRAWSFGALVDLGLYVWGAHVRQFDAWSCASNQSG